MSRTTASITIILLWLVAASLPLYAQSGTEVYLFDLQKTSDGYSLTNPLNISEQNPGYDNQPSFLPDGSGVLFASTRNGQTDVLLYEIESDNKKWLTESPGSEYSPTVIPGGTHFSTIILEEDGRQLLWKYSLEGGEPEIIVQELVIGYHTWLGPNRIYSFVLGEPPTLQETRLDSGESEVITQNPGRSLHNVPGTRHISFVDKSDSTNWIIKSLDPFEGDISTVTSTLNGSEDMAWTPDRIILMGQGSTLFSYNPYGTEEWKPVADLSDFGLSGITRLAVSPDGNKVAVVVAQE